MSRTYELELTPRFVENNSNFQNIVTSGSDYKWSPASIGASNFVNVGFIVFDISSTEAQSLGYISNGVTPFKVIDFSFDMRVNRDEGFWGVQLNSVTVNSRNSPYFTYSSPVVLSDYKSYTTSSTSFTRKTYSINKSDVKLAKNQVLAMWVQCKKNSGVLLRDIQIHMGNAKMRVSTTLYTVKRYDGNTLLGSAEVTSHKSYSIPTPSKTGHTFVKWTHGSNTYINSISSVTADMDLTAVWSVNKYKVNTAVQGNGTVSGGGTYDYGTSVQLSAQPAEGYKFVKWTDGVTTATRTLSVGAGDVTYTAVFEQKTYTVRYFPSDGWSNIPEAQTKQHGVDIRISSKIPTKEGYTFKCWHHDNIDYFPNDIYSLNEDILLGIVCNEWYYYVQYDANGGTNIPSAQTKYYFTDLTLSSNIPTRTGHTFLYWTTNQDGTGTKYNPGDTFTTNAATTLYAQWKKIQIDSAALTYNGAKISSTNKVPAGQGFLLSVGVSEVYA